MIKAIQSRDYFLIFISAVFLLLSFPRFDLEYLAWVALVPFFLAIEGKSAGGAGKFSFCLGLVFWLALLFWLRFVTVTGLVFLVIYLSFYFFLWGWGIKFVQGKTNFSLVIISPVLWVSLEWLRGVLFTGFPWMPLGNSQYLNLGLIQIADITGVYGLSFLIVAVNALLAEVLIEARKQGLGVFKNKRLGFFIVAGLIFISLGYGKRNLAGYETEETLKAAVIQGNISGDIKWSSEYSDYTREIYRNLSEEAASDYPDLIIWPETAVTVSLPDDLGWCNTLSFLSEESGGFLIAGSLYCSEEKDELFNSAFLISPKGKILERYDKIHLVPFGEYVPKGEHLPQFFDKVFQEAGDYTPGRKKTIFKMPQGNFNVLICFEDIFPGLVRQFVKDGSELLINISNDAWFGKTSAPFQHLAMSVFRAVENHRYVIRSANTGISAFINPQGKILGRLEDKNGNPLWVKGFLTKKVGLVRKLTFYTRFGDWFAGLNLLGSGILIALGFLRKGGNRETRLRQKNQGVR